MCQTYVKLIQCCCMIGAATLFSHALWGQTQPATDGGGSLFGTVRDSSGAAILGARLALEDEAGKVREARTDREGAYRFSTLRAGHYSLSAESQGFQAQSREVSANGQEPLTVNFVLVVQAQRQSVTVTDRLDRQSDYAPSATAEATLKTDTPLVLTPQSVETVPEAVLRDQIALTLSDATRNVAGVAQDFGFNGGAQTALIFRGFTDLSMTARSSMTAAASYYLDGNRVEGVPLNMADVQQVDVVKGPDSVIFGRAQPGGLVNVVTRPILPQFAADLEETASQLGATRSTASVSGRLNESGSLLLRASGTWFADKTGRAFVRDRLGSGGLTLIWHATPRTQLGLSLNYQHQAYRNDYGVPSIGDRPANLPYNRQFNDSPVLSTTQPRSARLTLGQELARGWRLNMNFLSLVSNYYDADITPYGINLSTGADCLGSGYMCLQYYYNAPHRKYRLVHGSADLTGKFRTGAVQHSALVGLDGYAAGRTGTQYYQQLAPVNVYNPVFTPERPLDPSVASPLDTTDETRWVGLYAQDSITLPYRLTLVAGVRADFTSAIYAPPGTQPNVQSFVKPRVGLVWQLSGGQAVYAQYQQALDSNNGRDAVTLQALAAETSNQFEFGYKVRARGEAITATVAAYQLVKDNIASFAFYPKIVTVGQQRSRGVEVDVRGRLTRRLSGIASYAYNDGVVTKDPTYQGERLPEAPRNSGSLWLRQSLGESWDAGAGIFAVGVRNGDYGSDFELPGYARLDAMLSHRFQTGAWHNTIQVNVLNLTNKLYYTGSFPIALDWIQLGRARTYQFTLRLSR
jgi:iron complex outermembrane receptor protein